MTRPYFIKQQPGAQVSARGPRLPSARRGVLGSVRSRINSRIIATNFGCAPAVAARTERTASQEHVTGEGRAEERRAAGDGPALGAVNRRRAVGE